MDLDNHGMMHQSQQELSVRPALLRGLLFEGFPLLEHVRQVELLEVQAQALVRAEAGCRLGRWWARVGHSRTRSVG